MVFTFSFFFFFQAEDGIRDSSVTGVQTYALPIWILSDIVNSQTGPWPCLRAVPHFSVSPAVLRFEDPQETALLFADAPRTRATEGAERNDARSGSSLSKKFAIFRMQASARPRPSSAGLSSLSGRDN